MLEILYKSPSAVIVYKPPGIASQPDNSSKEDALTLTAELLVKQGEKSSLYPVHRLDLVVGGLLVIARTKNAAAELSAALSADGIGKEYLAVCEGEAAEGTLINYLYKDKAQSKSVICSPERQGAKYAELDVGRIASKSLDMSKLTLAKITLKTGRFHQIRAQLSGISSPIAGDKKYGSKQRSVDGIALFAYRLSFTLSGEKITVTKFPNVDEMPWSHFAEEIDNLSRKE